jgi:sugar lactone lactonase YvrE
LGLAPISRPIRRAGAIVATCGWAKSGPGTRIAVFAPEGRLLEEHLVPAEPTNCRFGGADMPTLFVTAKDGRLYGAHSDRHGLLLVPLP